MKFKRYKDWRLYTKLIGGFLVIDTLFVTLLYTSYTSAANIIDKARNMEITPEMQATLDQVIAGQESYLSNYATFTSVMFVLVLGISTFLAIMLAGTLRRGAAEVNRIADALAEGKIDIVAKNMGNDEFGQMMRDMQKVIDNTRTNAEIAQAVASGDLTVQVTPKNEDDALGIALKTMVDTNQLTMSNIREAALQVTTSSAQVASASEALAQGSTEQASAIEEITVSISDVAEKTKQNAVQANTANELMGQAIEDVKKGNQEMKEMVTAMGEINEASENISKIIKVIDDIAFQTNILALNAAVEAARAGEAGQGFAVVADEVRSLAAKSAQAAAETAELIETSIKKVHVGSKIAKETAEALDDITKAVQQSEKMVHEIAESSSYQATAIAQIDKAIDQVSQVVQTNSATSEECAAASMELSSQASKVRELVSVFKVDDTDMFVPASAKGSAAKVSSSEAVISLQDGFGKY